MPSFPLAVYAGAAVAGAAFARLARGGDSGPATESEPAAAGAGADEWAAFGGELAQNFTGYDGGVLPTVPGGGGTFWDEVGGQPLPGSGNTGGDTTTRPPVVSSPPVVSPPPVTPRRPAPAPSTTTLTRPTAAPPSGAVGWIRGVAGSPVYDAAAGWKEGSYPVSVNGPRTAHASGTRWVSGIRKARLRDGRIVDVRRISNPGSAVWLSSFVLATGYPIYAPSRATVTV